MARFVVFEGLDGAGKSTHIRRLTESLVASDVAVEVVREPGGTEAGEAIRSIMFGPEAKPLLPLTWAFLMNSARAQLVRERIRPALEAGRHVVADRYWFSTLAYQGGGEGLDGDLIRTLSSSATEGLEPDMVVYLRLPPEEVATRKERQGLNILDSRPLDFHSRVAEAYDRMAEADTQRWVVFDATLPRKELGEMVQEVVAERLGIRFANVPS